MIDKKWYKYLRGSCSIDGKKKAMYVSDATIQGEGLGDFFKNIGKQIKKVGIKAGKNIAKNPVKFATELAEFGMTLPTAKTNPGAVLKEGMDVVKVLRGGGLRLGQFEGGNLYLTMR